VSRARTVRSPEPSPVGSGARSRGRRVDRAPPWSTWPPAARWAIGAGLALSLALLMLHASGYRFLTDDAYIAFRYARNLSNGFGLVFNPGYERVEGYSDFLWVLALAGLARLGLAPEHGALILSAAATVALWAMVAWFSLRAARDARTAWVALIPLFLLAATRSIAVWSTGGLETRWFEMLAVAGALRLVVEVEAHRDRAPLPALASWLFGLAAWTRPDGLLLAGCGFIAGAAGVRRCGRLAAYARGWLPCALLVAGQFAFRGLYYGQWLPNTYYAKVDGRTWWGTGFEYLAAWGLEYAAYLWIPLLVLAVRAHRARRTLFVPALFAVLILPHALYVASVGGDHFEFRPLDLYFPFLFLLIADGMRRLAEGPRAAWLAVAYAALVALGLWEIPWQSHRQFPQDYRSGFPGRDLSPAARMWLDPVRDPLYRLPGLSRVANAHRRLLATLSQRYVGLRAEEHRSFLATVVPDGLLLRSLIRRGLLPRDLYLAMGCVGAIPYLADVRTLDLLGLTDATVAHQPFRTERSMGHDKFASDAYVRERGVDIWALAGIHPFVPEGSERLAELTMEAAVQHAEWYVADVGDGEYLACTFPAGVERARSRMPHLAFERMGDSSFARPELTRAATMLRASLARRPGDRDGWTMLGDVDLFLGECEAAAGCYEHVLAGGSDELRLRLNLANAYGCTAHPERAIPSLRRALEMARSNGDERLAHELAAGLATLENAR
jgi:arabinofuranosyltransferase